MTITDEAAARIAATHNDYLGISGGVLVFEQDGTGGAWWKEGAYGFEPTAIVLRQRGHRITAADVQAIVDAMAADG